MNALHKHLIGMAIDYKQKLNESNLLINSLIKLILTANQESLRQNDQENEDLILSSINKLAELAERKDETTGHHLKRTSIFSGILATQLKNTAKYHDYLTTGQPRWIKSVIAATPLHDIGKIGISDTILKKPGKLDPSEILEMQRHPIIGAHINSTFTTEYGRNSYFIVATAVSGKHHERWDGNGYPSGLEGESIPLSARLVALVDVYDALTDKRPYKDPWSHKKATEYIAAESGAHFDPTIVDCFLNIHKKFADIKKTYH